MRLNWSQGQGLPQQRVVEQVDLADREVVFYPLVGIDGSETCRSQRSGHEAGEERLSSVILDDGRLRVARNGHFGFPGITGQSCAP
ncbi:hypothetical protein ASF58_24310 [Methylobacterium sp. Leaf125]|nr:hypothetical protein ASF58_24310 [Methylobacterium sp. Leaf125]